MERVVKLASGSAVVIFSVNNCCMFHAVKRLFCGMGVNPTHRIQHPPKESCARFPQASLAFPSRPNHLGAQTTPSKTVVTQPLSPHSIYHNITKKKVPNVKALLLIFSFAYFLTLLSSLKLSGVRTLLMAGFA